MDYKALMIGDLHLYNQEIRSTLKMVDNNEVMLKNLYQHIVEDETIVFVASMGDIQHKTPTGKNTLKETRIWERYLIKIGELLKQRIISYGLHLDNVIQVFTDDGEYPFMEKMLNDKVYPFFTLKGNHDEDNDRIKNKENLVFTFYDSLIDDGIIFNPKTIITNFNNITVQFEFFNYGFADRAWTKHENVEQTVGLFHDTIDSGELESGLLHGEYYKLENICEGLDLIIDGHIHTLYTPVKLNYHGQDVIFWIVGSMGRTSFVDAQIRDVGYCGQFVIGDLVNLSVVEIDLIPKEEYFDYRQMIIQRDTNRDYKNFSVQIEDVQIDRYDPRNDISNLDIEDSVKNLCIKYLTEVMES